MKSLLCLTGLLDSSNVATLASRRVERSGGVPFFCRVLLSEMLSSPSNVDAKGLVLSSQTGPRLAR